MVPQCPLDALPGVIELAEDAHSSHAAALRRVIGHPVLLPAQQHVPVALAVDPAEEAPLWGAEGKADILFGTFAHEGGRGPGIGKREYLRERMERKTAYLALSPLDHYVFAVQRKIGILGGDEKGVEQLFHASMAPFR